MFLRAQAEALARAQFIRRKDPYDCALLYLALGKKSLLSGLFKQVELSSCKRVSSELLYNWLLCFLPWCILSWHNCKPWNLLRLPLQTSNTRVSDFLSRNFEDEGSRRAAAKNAFALLGQHK